jgi:hypothetical protein
MRIVSQYCRQIYQFIWARGAAASLVSWAVLAVWLAALSVLFVLMGAPAMNGRAWDTALYLEGAWRIACGQVPHRDFYSCLGVLPFYVTWLGMKLSHPCVSAIAYGNVFVMVALGVSAMAVLRRRTSSLYALMMSLFLALLAVTPRPLGDSYQYTDYAMLYNRYGEAFLGLLGSILFLPPEPSLPRSWADGLEIAFAGGLLIILLFCKVNYFVMGFGFFVLAWLLGRFSAGGAVLFLLSAAAVLGVVSFATHIPATAIFQDYRISAGVTDVTQRLRAATVHTIENLLLVPVLGILLWELASRPGERNPSRAGLFRHGIVLLFLFGGALLLLSSDCQEGEMPLMALAGLYGAEIIRRDTSAAQEDSFLVTVRNLGGLAIFALLLVPTFATDCKTVLFAARDALETKWVSTATLMSTRLNDFRFVKNGTRFAEMREYMDSLDEAIQMLRRHSDPRMRLTGWLFSNPYQFALGWTPAMGGLIDLGDASVAKRSHPPLKRLLGDATHILVDVPDCLWMKDAYGVEWDALHLEVVDKTKYHTLFKIPPEPGK